MGRFVRDRVLYRNGLGKLLLINYILMFKGIKLFVF